MSELNESNVESVVAACKEGISAISESLNQCFDTQYRLEVGYLMPWGEMMPNDDFEKPGLAATFTIGEGAATCLIPAGLPLPAWYTAPNDSESSRLQTLAMEWSMNMMPADIETDAFETTAIASLKGAIVEQEPVEWAHVLELNVFDANSPSKETTSDESTSDEAEKAEATDDAPANDEGVAEDDTTDDSEAEADTESDAEATSEDETSEEATDDEPDAASGDDDEAPEPLSTLLLVWGVRQAAVTAVDPPPAAESAPEDSADSSPAPDDNPEVSGDALAEARQRIRRVSTLPVNVIVQLAGKKIEMKQLVSLSPGTLITFNKSCEDLLDLYVNNRPYCRGEAVKIGEKFGLKINQVGVDETEQRANIL